MLYFQQDFLLHQHKEQLLLQTMHKHYLVKRLRLVLDLLVGLGSAVADLTGQAVTGSVGSISPADTMGLTGVSFTGSVGSITPADQVMGLTGLSSSLSVGAVNVKAYADIDTGSNTSYSNISTGSNTSYSDVATGSNTSYNDVTGEAA